MTDFRFAAVQFLRAQSLTQITDLARRNYNGFSPDEREALVAIAKAITREIIEKRREERRKEQHDETGKTNA